MVFLAIMLVLFLIRDRQTVREDGTLDPNSSNFISRSVGNFLIRQHEQHYGPGTATKHLHRTTKHKPMPDALGIVVYTTVLTTLYIATHMSAAGNIDANVHRLFLPVLIPANAVNTHGMVEGFIWGVVLGGPLAAGLGVTLARAARSGEIPVRTWPDLRLPVLLILLSAGYAALTAAAIAQHLTRSQATPEGDTLLIIFLAHAVAAGVILPSIFVLSMLTVSRRLRTKGTEVPFRHTPSHR